MAEKLTVNYNSKIHSPCYVLTWHRYREILDFSINLPTTGIILLDGNTGVGKSNIFKALLFLFYGEGDSFPRWDREKKTKNITFVQLKFPDETLIYRQKGSSNLLLVRKADLELCDEAAQSYINNHIGSYNNWMTGGYIEQIKMCGIFGMSSNEKFQLMQELITHFISMPEKFKDRLDKINSLIETNKKNHEEYLFQIKVLSENYKLYYDSNKKNIEIWNPDKIQEVLSKYGIISKTITEDIIQEIRNLDQANIKNMRKEIHLKEIELTRIQENIKTKINIEKYLDENQNIINSIQCLTNEELTFLENKRSELELKIGNIKRKLTLTKLETQKEFIENKLVQIPKDFSSYKLNDLENWSKVISEKQSVEDEINTIQKEINYKESFELYSELQTLENKIRDYPTHSMISEIENIDKEILYEHKLVCPKCDSLLYLHNQKLQILENKTNFKNLEQLKVERKYLLQKEEKYKERLIIEKNISTLKSKLDKNFIPQHVPVNTFNLTEKLKVLLQIPKNLDVLSEKRKYNNMVERNGLERDLKFIESEINKFKNQKIESGELIQIQAESAKIKKKLDDEYATRNKLNSLFSIKENLENQLKSLCLKDKSDECLEIICDLKDKLKNLEKSSVFLELDLRDQIYINNLNNITIKLKELDDKLTVTSFNSIPFEKIKTSIITSEYVMIDQILTEINSTVNEILPELFDQSESIFVYIHALRTLKSKKGFKPQINIQIIHRGNECSKISELSVGQAVRVSIAMAIAFSKYSNIPFLLLDECLMNLDSFNREKTIDLISRYIPNKLVISAGHDTLTGIYDDVITLTKD